ncbi:MAG: glycosyl transferase [Acidimicrobiaceae bacterium]|nr:glycosyl transferase [Acidimicrobiaceae bacterium]
MKILFISPKYSGAGGIGPHAFRVAEKLREHGFDVELMHVPHIPIKNMKNLSYSVFGTLQASFNKKKYDVVHAWNVPSAFIMRKITAKMKILSVHGVYSQQIGMLHSKLTGSIIKSKESQVLDWADILTTDSKSVQLEYKKLGKDFVYLPAPLDPKKFQGLPDIYETKNQIVYVGRDSFEKGIDILQSIESKINATVKYCTNMEWSDAMKIIKESKILIVPSRVESIPQVIKEAFFLKIPVIATDVGGIPELIIHGKTGILIPSENPDQMIHAINELLPNEKLKEELSNNAFDFINKNFSWDSLIQKYIDLYETYV